MIKNARVYPFPDDFAAVKGFDWILKYAKAAHSKYEISPPTIFYNNRSKYYEWRDYAMGNQTIDKYKPMMGVDEQNSETYLNVDWKVLGILPKYLRIAIEGLNKIGYNMKVSAVDPLAETEKSKWYAKQMAKIKLQDAVREMAPEMEGKIPALQPQPDDAGDTEELEIMNGYTYQNNRARKFKKALKLVAVQNDIASVREKLKEDGMYYGVAAVKDYIDSNGTIRFRNCNVDSLMMSPCVNNDFSDARYVGEYLEMSVSELRQLAQDQFTEAQYQDICKNISKRSDMVDSNVFYPYAFNYDNYRVRVLDLEIYTIKSRYRQLKADNHGNLYYNSLKNPPPESDNTPSKYTRKDYQVIYRCKWVVGSELMFDYGLMTDMKRPKKSPQNVKSSFHIFAPIYQNYSAFSRIEKAMPVADAMQLAWYKFQNELNRVVPNGWAINLDAIENVSLGKGGDNWTPDQVMNLFFQAGVLVYRGMDLRGSPHSHPVPIERLANGIGADVMNYYKIFDAEVQKLRDILGVNEIQDGSGSADRTNKEGLKMEYEASNNALADIIRMEKHILKSLYESLIIRIQDVVKVKPIEGYLQELGSSTGEFIKADMELAQGEFTLDIKDKPDDASRLKLEQLINDAYAKQELDARDLFIIEGMEDIVEAQALLSYKIAKYKKKNKEDAIQKMQLEVSLSGQQVQQKLTADLTREKQSWELKSQYLQLEKALQKQLQDEKYAYEMKMNGVDAAKDIQKTVIGTQSREKIAGMKENKSLLGGGV